MQFQIALSLTMYCFVSQLAFAQTDCEFNPWKSYQDTNLLAHPTSSAYLFSSAHMAIDADGAPNTYHPDNIGLDYLANAGYPNTSWWPSVLVQDRNNPQQAYRQTSGEFAGYFVSKTSLFDSSKAETDPARYVDARNIPYLVFPGAFYKMQGTGLLGDLGYAINLASGEKTAFVVADVGPSNAKLGEVSIALAEGLGGSDVSPKNGAGAPRGETLYIVFPYSQRTYGWPLSLEEMDSHANTLLEAAGGIEAILSCKNSLNNG